MAASGCDLGAAPSDLGSDPGTGSSRDRAWSCQGTVGSTPSPSGSYYITAFGCWVDENGTPRGDAGDNCVPWCKFGAAQEGTGDEYDALCGGLSGPECERSLNWYAADSDRFGCMTRLQVTNPENGKAAVVVVLDRGPACRIERRVDHWVLDLSAPANNYLFGGPQGSRDRAEVVVDVVPPGTPLGPVAAPERPAWIGDACTLDDECDYSDDGTCQTWFDEDADELRGTCTSECAGYCPDRAGRAVTFCAQTAGGRGQCLARATPENDFCGDIPGAAIKPLRRYLGDSGAPDAITSVCVAPQVAGIECEAGGETGECIDDDLTSCDGVLHTGACPGPANILCCVP